MDGQGGSYQPGSDLPQPQNEANGPAAPIDQPTEQTLPQMPPPSPEPSAAAQSVEPPIAPSPLNSDDGSDPVAALPSPSTADDTDLIEQEWVDKAKAIVETTKADPYAQNKEINKMKADYIKKRYNKEIKVITDE